MSKLIEVNTQDGQTFLINTKYIIKIIDSEKYGAILSYDNGGQKEEINTELNYAELKKLIQD